MQANDRSRKQLNPSQTKLSQSQYSLPSRPVSALPYTHKKPASSIVKVTDETGSATFENVPINNYIISVDDSKNFMGNEKSLNLISERTIQPSFSLFIELKPQVYSFVEVNLQDDRGFKVSQAAVSALLLTTNEALEVDRYLFDLYNNDRGLYTATLVPGEYIINATVPGYKELSEYFTAVKGECQADFKLVKKTPSQLSITAIDAASGLPVAGALLRLSTPIRTMNVEALTDANGKSVYTTDGCGYYNLTVSREGYVPYVKEMCVSKRSLKDIVVPLIPLVGETVKTSIQICLSGDAAAKGMAFKIYCPKGEEVLNQIKLQSEANAAKILKGNTERVGAVTTIASGADEWYRVCVEITDSNLLRLDKSGLDKYIQNTLQSLNVVVHITVNDELKYTLYPPSGLVGKVWDLGFINALNGELMAVNAISDASPNTRLEFCNEYLSFYAYVYQKQNPRLAFGFDKAGVYKLEDIVMDPQIFAQFVSKVLNLSGPTAEEFINLLIGGVSDLFGKVSLKLLTRLINLHMTSACEMEYSKTIGSPTGMSTTGKKLEFGFLKSSPSTQQKRPPTAGKEMKKPVASNTAAKSPKTEEENIKAQEEYQLEDDDMAEEGDSKKAEGAKDLPSSPSKGGESSIGGVHDVPPMQ